MRLQVKELEEQLKNQGASGNNSTWLPSLPTPSAVSTTSAVTTLDTFDTMRDHGGNKKHWGGIHTSVSQARQTQYYGPPSQFYFIGEICSYLGTAFQQPHSDHHMQPNSASKSFASPTSSHKEGGDVEQNQTITPLATNDNDLTRMQEDYFPGLFWQSYHCTMPILDETQFREHYESLWPVSGTSRKPSALVDIVLAICMQYGSSSIPRSDSDKITQPKVDVDSNDSQIAGRWFYRRCQTVIRHELESPSITTLQCHLLSVIYLCNASFQNMAHATLALAIRIGQTLGLHLEPPKHMPHA